MAYIELDTVAGRLNASALGTVRTFADPADRGAPEWVLRGKVVEIRHFIAKDETHKTRVAVELADGAVVRLTLSVEE